MKNFCNPLNGIATDYHTGEIHYLNAHFSYKGRSIIIDYEWCLHCYSEVRLSDKDNIVPFEMYPYDTDLYVGYVSLDKEFKKADMAQLLKDVDEALENENK